MITSNRGNLIKEGYLDVKVPPGNRERKLWKAWQRRWLVSNSVETPCGLELQIYGCQKTSNNPPLWTVFISPECGKLYRSRSRTHACTFSIANSVAVVLHLAGESEQVSQSWMAAMRDALWPPSPLVQLEAAFQDVHRVSLIDDETTCHTDLFAAYGHLYMAGDVILLMSTHSGKLIKQWHLSEVLNVGLERLDEGKTSGVFSLTLQNGSLQHGEKLNFYSQTADFIVQNMSAALKMRGGKESSSSIQKYDSGIEELSELLTLESEGCDRLSSLDSDGWSSHEPSEGLRKLATISGDFLNCSVNSVFMHQDFSGGSRTSSEASSDYTPPVSPTDPTSPNQNEEISPARERRFSKDLLDHYYHDVNAQIRRNSLEGTDFDYALIVQPRSSTCSGIYADITSLPPSKRPSLAETLYEDIEEDEEGFIKLMDEIMEDEYLPPLPPPRNVNTDIDDHAVERITNKAKRSCTLGLENTDIDDHPMERITNKAKRPSTLGLENLSSSITETLFQMQSQYEPNCKTNKKNSPLGLFKPIKGVKRILSFKKNVKTPLSSPTNENFKNTALSNHNLSPDAENTADIGHASESLLIMQDTNSPEVEPTGNSDSESVCSSAKNSPVHNLDEHFVPFPELSSMDCKNTVHVHQNDAEQQKNILSDEIPSVVLREGQRGKQARSCDSILVEILKSKSSCHRQFLQFLHVDKNEDANRDTVPHVCEQKCILRSVSLELLPCKSSHCRQHSTSNTFPYSLVENFRNETSENAAVPGINATNLEGSVLKDFLSRRRSSDYCAMGPLVSPNSDQDPEIYVPMCVKEKKARKDSVNQEWSNSLHMQITEHESLYMDMTRTTK